MRPTFSLLASESRRARARRGVRAPRGARDRGPGARGPRAAGGRRCPDRGRPGAHPGGHGQRRPGDRPAHVRPLRPGRQAGRPLRPGRRPLRPGFVGRARARPGDAAAADLGVGRPRPPRACRRDAAGLRRPVDRRRLPRRAGRDRRPLPALPRAAPLGQADRHRGVPHPARSTR